MGLGFFHSQFSQLSSFKLSFHPKFNLYALYLISTVRSVCEKEWLLSNVLTSQSVEAMENSGKMLVL